MKSKKLKCYVLTISHNFPAYHPRKGEETNFPLKIEHKEKIHTIRSNYHWWKKRIDEIRSGNAYLSVRVWTGKPYKSKQKEVFQFHGLEVGVQPLNFHHKIDHKTNFFGKGGIYDVNKLAQNDGLKVPDFISWFKPYKPGILAIIHFTKFRY